MIAFFSILIKILLCLLLFLALILIIPVKYILDITISNENQIYFRLSYCFGFIKFEYRSGQKNKFKISGVNLIKNVNDNKNNSDEGTDNKNFHTLAKKISSLHEENIINKNNFSFENIRPLLSPTLEFIKDIIEKVKPNLIEISGHIGFEDPAYTGYASILMSFAQSITNVKPNIKYDFENEIFDLNIILHGKMRALLFIFIMIKYLRNEHVFSFIKNNFISKEVY